MDPLTRRDWCARIKRRRQELGLNQEKAAARARTDQGTWSKIERGSIKPSDDFKWRIAGALLTSVEDLFPWPAVTPPVPSEQVAS